MKYLVGTAGLTGGVLVKKRGSDTVLVHSVMEREEAKVTGFQLKDFEEFGYLEIVKKYKHPVDAQKEFLTRIIKKLGIEGKIGLYGRAEVSRYYHLMEDLGNELEGIEWLREGDIDIFTAARVTKDRDEIESIRSVGHRTGKVIGEVVDFLRAGERVNGVVVNPENKEPLRVGDMKQFIKLALAREGLQEEEETIFSIGYDTSVPHNRGKDDDKVEVGQPIVFDIFPADARNGYHYDVTRSMVIGDPPEEFVRLYEDVKGACDVARTLLARDESACGVNQAVIDYFEKKGHPTLKSEKNVTDGYIHSLGHGIGLNGMVFTVEPGLYYPGKSIGVRIEDVYWINEDGVGEKVVDIPYTDVIK
jgi:Xaa-Pro aminopeptidase